MTVSTASVLQYLFGTDRLEEVSIDQLKELVDEYPSFNAGHFLLSTKLQQEKDNSFLPETQKTALHFHNPFWLQWLLQNNGEEQTPKETEPEFSNEYLTKPEIASSNLFGYEEKTFQADPQINEITTTHQQELINSEEPAVASQYTEETYIEKSYESNLPEPEIHHQEIESYHQPEETQKEEEIETSYPINHISDEKTDDSISLETIAYNDDPKQLKEEYQQEEIQKEEEPLPDFHHINNGHDEIIHDTAETGSTIINWHEELVTETHQPQIIEEQQPATNFNIDNNGHDESIHETLPEPEIFHEHSEQIKEEPKPEEIQVEENSTGIHKIIDTNDEITSNTTIPDQPVIADHVEPVTEDHSHEHKQQEEDSPVVYVNNSHAETVYDTTVPEQVEESNHTEHIEEIKEEVAKEPVIQEETAPEILETKLEEEHIQPETISFHKSEETASEPMKHELVFEPYYTIDYFASQGIRFIPEENPTDRFGKQLKSFTAWLKVMKRLPQKPLLQEPVDDVADAQIQIIAANSIEEKDVITEAMAEVLAKQDKIDSAIDLYLKLSLLNPIKIAYFAAKIEELKRRSL